MKSEIAKRIREETNKAIYQFRKHVGRKPSNEEIFEITQKVLDQVIDEYQKEKEKCTKS